MRVLLLTGSPARYMAPPQLADEQIVAGPDWPDVQTPEGKWLSLRTPIGEYDLSTLLARIPSDQQPDAIVSLVDASWRNQPRNLTSFRGPKALLVADTHHLSSPLIGMFKYAATEPYDRIVFLYDRHHMAFFQSAGFRNLYWFPGLTFPHDDATVRSARAKKREKRIAFVGQAGRLHPQRTRLLASLKAHDLAIEQRQLSQRDALGFYGTSLVGFNASLNGDLNLRVFEIMATGSALLTDRLAPESGLLELFDHGRELLTYSSAEELAERAAHALAHPKETAAIGAAGAAWFDEHFNAARRQAAFQELLINGTAVPEFAGPAQPDTRIYFSGDTTQLLSTMMVYEGMQELHRTEEKVRVVLTPGVDEDIADICATLPRVEVTRGDLFAPADIAIFTRDDDIVPGAVQAPRVWCCDALPEERTVLNDYFAAVGYTPVSADVAVLCRIVPQDPRVRIQSALESGDARLLLGGFVAQEGDNVAAILALTQSIRKEPRMIIIWHALGLALRAAGRIADGVSALLRATLLGPVRSQLQIDLGQMALELGHGTIAGEAASALLAVDPDHVEAQRILAEAKILTRSLAALGPRDLLLCHEEVTHRQGTGVLLKRFFPDATEFLTVRSRTFHNGKVELSGTHFALDLPELSADVRKVILGRLLAPYQIRRILCVPYFASDYEHALAAKELTQAPLCTFAMDDQTVYCRQVPRDLARRVFAASELRLVISPEMAAVYGQTFKLPFHFMPPVLTHADDSVSNRWSPALMPAKRVAMIGNVWTAKRFQQLRAFVRSTGWTVDWFGPGPKAAWLRAEPDVLLQDGICCRGFLPEAELIAALADYPAVVIPSGMLDAEEDNEAFSRLSLPSRMLFVLVKTRTPMLVLGSRETAAGRFVLQHGIGLCTSYDPAEATVRLNTLTDRGARPAYIAAAEKAAGCYVLSQPGEWIWNSLAQRKPQPAPFNSATEQNSREIIKVMPLTAA